MKTTSDLLYDKYLDLQICGNLTLRQLYNSIIEDIANEASKVPARDLEHHLSPYKSLGKYYSALIFESNAALELTDTQFAVALTALARESYIQKELRYMHMLRRENKIKYLTELKVLFNILSILTGVEPTEEELREYRKDDKYKYYKTVNKKANNNKNLALKIIGAVVDEENDPDA